MDRTESSVRGLVVEDDSGSGVSGWESGEGEEEEVMR